MLNMYFLRRPHPFLNSSYTGHTAATLLRHTGCAAKGSYVPSRCPAARIRTQRSFDSSSWSRR